MNYGTFEKAISFPFLDMDQLIQLRHILHSNPELSGQESYTANYIINYVKQFKPDILEKNIGGYGLIVGFTYGDKGPKVMIRCELDALPIEEYLQLDYASKNPGVSHKCGHDGHMVMVAGLAEWLKYQKFIKGTVLLLFQPAEETGKGAITMLDDPKFEPYNPDFIFALHNLPGYPKGAIIQLGELFNATVVSMGIFINGKTSHASEPEKGLNPSITIATLLTSINSLSVPDEHKDDYTLITPIYTSIGTRDYGISPGIGEVHFTIRTWTPQRMKEVQKSIEALVIDQCNCFGLKYSIETFDYFPSVVNDSYCNSVIEKAAINVGIHIVKKPTPIKFGEDFGYFSQHFRGAMFGLGTGESSAPLHSIHYDFPDEIIPDGINIFKDIITQILTDNNN